jgi:hypothetical protein
MRAATSSPSALSRCVRACLCGLVLCDVCVRTRAHEREPVSHTACMWCRMVSHAVACCRTPTRGGRAEVDDGLHGRLGSRQQGRPGYTSGEPSRPKHPSHSPSTWARPAPPRQPGQAITRRTSHGRPIQPALPAYMTHLPSNISRARLHPARLANGRFAYPVSRRRAARPTGPPIAPSCGVRRHLTSCGSEHQCPPALQGAPSLPI